MKISYRTKENYQIFDIEGNIAFEETQNLEDFVFQNISSDSSNIVINLKQVPYLNSSALGSMVRMLQTLKTRNIKLYIMNINDDIKNLFTITGVMKYFEFIDYESIV
ncbi:MAG: STAS domain-containing protein [Spirochaetes bacterium]|nr:STAS domain-containing protein [Spirochaetota bacterium]